MGGRQSAFVHLIVQGDGEIWDIGGLPPMRAEGIPVFTHRMCQGLRLFGDKNGQGGFAQIKPDCVSRMIDTADGRWF